MTPLKWPHYSLCVQGVAQYLAYRACAHFYITPPSCEQSKNSFAVINFVINFFSKYFCS